MRQNQNKDFEAIERGILERGDWVVWGFLERRQNDGGWEEVRWVGKG